MRHISTGPKGQPTRGFLAAVDHSTLIHSVTATSPGRFNDKTTVVINTAPFPLFCWGLLVDDVHPIADGAVANVIGHWAIGHLHQS